MNTNIPDDPKCPKCGTKVSADALDGQCPACLLALNLGEPTCLADDAGASAPARGEPPAVADLAPLFPQLEITELLGRGGMGAVYKARQKELDRVVALKILPPDTGRDPAFAERFAREAKALARLSHPNIVTLFEFGSVADAGRDGVPSYPEASAPVGRETLPSAPGRIYYFVMEFVDGMNLGQLLRAGRLSPREALAIVPQICDALQYAHDQGIVHRDIKPENILLDRQGRVKVADFGLAKLVGAGALSDASDVSDRSETNPVLTTQAGHVLGTPQYMAPEQREHPSAVDHRADIYSLGVVFYQMLTGELPKGELVPPSRKVVLDVRLDEVVLRALERKPELRYQQVSEVKTMVETIAHEEGARVPPLPSPPVRAAPSAGRAPAPRSLGPVWLVTVLHVIGLLVLVGLLTVQVPRFEALFRDFGAALPPFTRGVIAVSHFLRYGGILMLLVVLPVLGAADWTLCWLAQRLGGRKLLAVWAVLGLLGQGALLAGIVGAVFMPMSQTVTALVQVGSAPPAVPALLPPGVPGPAPTIVRVTVEGRRAFIEGRGSPDTRFILRVGQGYTSCDFITDSPFTATYDIPMWGRGLNGVVKDAFGNVLLTLDGSRVGPMTEEKGRIVFSAGTPEPAPDGSYPIGEFRPQTGPPVPISVSLEKRTLLQPAPAVQPNRLAEDPDVPAVAIAPKPAAKKPAGQGAPSPAFGPETLRTVTDQDADDQGLLFFDFETGASFKPPFPLKVRAAAPGIVEITPELKRWIEEHDVDLLFRFQPKTWSAMYIGLQHDYLAQPDDWNTLPAEKVTEYFAKLDVQGRVRDFIVGASGGCDYETALGGQAFRTRRNTMGVLQTEGFANSMRRGLMLRYRLVQTAGQSQPRAPRLGDRLEFRFVAETNAPASAVEELPHPDDPTGRRMLRVCRDVMLDERAVARATVETDDLGAPQILIALTPAGTKRFAELTGANIGKQLAIVLDGKVQSAPVIREAITGGKAMISGRFTIDEAAAIAKMFDRRK